ncbi:hypothetical protein SAMN05445504_7133 [Burkholderia sp. CF099]|nr:hypothetical protein SAMN05445504_7133 [Burkholderia sp. CF099]
MKATIVHDDHGKIVSIYKHVNLKDVKSKFVQVGVEPGHGQRAMEVDLSDDLDKIPMVELHENYCIEISSSSLIKKRSESET